jgi:RimJ/RimL family protein N-acetyltransferase
MRSGAHAMADLEQLWRRIVFYMCVSNVDDHLRNHGFLHVDRANRTAEIGWTFLGREARRTVANTEVKYLQLRHLFEDQGAQRVWLQTDKLNERSQQAILRIGAVKEGELRDDRLSFDGRIRTSVVFGITRPDWPRVRVNLEALLAR